MNRITKKLLLFYSFFLIFLVGIILFIVFVLPNNKHDYLDIFNQQSDNFVLDEDPSYVFAPTPEATTVPVQDNEWALNIQDAMSVPIPLGIVTFGSESVSFANGHCVISATDKKKLNIMVSAEGYASKEFTITPGYSELVLDYLCNFSVLVENDWRQPVPDANVLIWKSDTPPRPVGNMAVAYTQDMNTLGNAIHLTQNGEECTVSWVDKPRSSFDTYGSPDGEVFPQRGDILLSLGSATWLPDYDPLYIHQDYKAKRWTSVLGGFLPLAKQHSSRLRIWDTIRLTEQSDSNKANINKQVLEIVRDGQRFFYYQVFPKCPENQTPYLEEKTNKDGEIILRDVPPAIYYVQAHYGQNQFSSILPVHPACGGAKLRLKNSGHFRVEVKREGLPTNQKFIVGVPNAEVVLQSQPGFKLCSKNTDFMGMADYRDFPYGKYKLTVNALGKTVEKNIVFNQPVDSCQVTIQQDEFYTVSGIVLEQDTKEPVADFDLKLIYNKGPRGEFTYQEVSSDAEGRFEFYDIIPNQYWLADNLTSTDNLNYVFAKPYMSSSISETSTHTAFLHLNVYEDITDLEVLVKPIVKTTFSGVVVDSQSHPVSNASFKINPRLFGGGDSLPTKVHPTNFTTDSSGLFTLTIFHNFSSDVLIYDFEIAAMVGDMLPPRWVPIEEKPGNFELIREKFSPSLIGSIKVKGKIGETFEDLQIVMESREQNKSFRGKIIAEGKMNFNEDRISATQNNLKVDLKVNEDGTFSAKNVASGEMRIVIYPSMRESVNTPYGPKEYYKYINNQVEIIKIKEDLPETYVEIPLKPSGYFWGHVLDNNNTPIPGVGVGPKTIDDPNDFIGSAKTDQKGFFFISSPVILADKNYNLEYNIGEQNKKIENVKPNTGNLVLQKSD